MTENENDCFNIRAYGFGCVGSLTLVMRRHPHYDYYFFDEYFRLLRALYGWSHHDMRVNEERLRKEREEKRKEYASEREAFMKTHGNEGAPVA